MLSYSNDVTSTMNKYGRVEDGKNVPAILEAETLLRKNCPTIKSARFLAEMYVRDANDRPLRVSDFVHYLKGGDAKLREKICLGFFDFVELNGKKINEDWRWKLEEMKRMLGNTKRVHVLPFCQAKTKLDIEKAWNNLKNNLGYEGLVIHTEDTTYKMKPEIELDAVIVAMQKNDGYTKKQVTSVRCALMTGPDTFLEIGDVSSGITHQLRHELWKFKTEFGLQETDKMAYVHPLIVIKIRINGFFTKDMPKWKLVNGERVDLGLKPSITMRHPCLEEIRQDKEPNVHEIGLNQIPKISTGDKSGDVDQ